jgi:hypothetical protein
VARLHLDGTLDEELVDRHRARVAVAVDLVGRVSNDYIELHAGHLLGGVCAVDE